MTPLPKLQNQGIQELFAYLSDSIEHSEDVHTGFQLQTKGWHLLYIPVILAKGLCPSELKAFFKQQYRWCMGSMSLLTSRSFWETKLSIRARMCYSCGFMYYIHTAIYVIFTPVVPLIMLLALPEESKRPVGAVLI